VIGRTFSLDGGGGHNPIEPAQLGCAVVHGPLTQNLENIFDEMNQAGAALRANTPEELYLAIERLLSSAKDLDALQHSGLTYAQSKTAVLSAILDDLKPALVDCGMMGDSKACA
jgi:3-deoxy-D-manno-octulosonic-acid transferase